MDSLHALEEEAQRCKNDNRFLRINSTNVDGLDEEKKEELNSLIEDGIEIICLQETKRRRDDLHGDLKFEGYKTVTVEREGREKQGKPSNIFDFFKNEDKIAKKEDILLEELWNKIIIIKIDYESEIRMAKYHKTLIKFGYLD